MTATACLDSVICTQSMLVVGSQTVSASILFCVNCCEKHFKGWISVTVCVSVRSSIYVAWAVQVAAVALHPSTVWSACASSILSVLALILWWRMALYARYANVEVDTLILIKFVLTLKGLSMLCYCDLQQHALTVLRKYFQAPTWNHLQLTYLYPVYAL